MIRYALAAIVGLVAVTAVSAAPTTTTVPATNPAIAEVVRDRQGLCVVLGAGRAESASLVADLARGSRLLVHGLALDEAARQRAVKAIESAGVAGQASVGKLDGTALPYLRDLANLVVIEDMAALEKAGVTMQEIDRITSPGGVVCVLKDGRWTPSSKTRPSDMDDWRHPSHGPDGNHVSKDRVTKFPIGLRWTDGLPVNLVAFTDCRAWVIANNRLFTLGINEPENVGAPKAKNKFDEYLTARDAFSGLPLWKLNCKNLYDGMALNWINYGPIAADDAFVYVAYETNKVAKVDAATGKVLWTAEAKNPVYKLLLVDGVVLTSNWAKLQEGFTAIAPTPKSGTVEAFAASDGKPLWQIPQTAMHMVAGDGRLYMELKNGEKPTITAVEIATGKDAWSISQDGPEADLNLHVAGPGFLAVQRTIDKKKSYLEVVSAKDGQPLWDAAKAGYRAWWVPLVDGALIAGSSKVDPLTGQIKGNFGSALYARGCLSDSIAGPYVIKGRSGAHVELPEASDPKAKAKILTYMAARSACLEGMTAADGMLYTGQNHCRCMPAHLYGFLAMGPTGGNPTPEEFAKPGPVEQGPAFGAALSGAAAPGQSWPMLLGNAERSSSVKCSLPEELKEAWSVEAVAPADGPMSMAWKSQLAPAISPPVVEGGLVFVTATDLGQVMAFDAAKGQKAWTVTLDSRVDGPPTLHRGVCIVACHDGWVYALRSKDGQLAWRARIAPRDRRVVDHGRVESLWPVTGGVLVDGDIVYATAGRATETDGGLATAALDVATGKTLWSRNLPPGPQRLNDVFAMREGKLVWRLQPFDKASGEWIRPPAPASQSQPATGKGAVTKATGFNGGGANPIEGPLADGTYTVILNRRGGAGFEVAGARFDLLAWDANRRVGPTGDVGPDGKKGAWIYRATGRTLGVALTDNQVVYLQRSTLWGSPSAKGSINLVSAEKGERKGTLPLPAVPVYNGLAVAGGRLFVTLEDGRLMCFGG